MAFQSEKKQFLQKPDKSSAGEIDAAIIKLVGKINNLKEYYTKSSCAGRILLIKDTGEKQENAFLFVSHEKVSLEIVKQEIEKVSRDFKGLIYLKMEPCILHVACSNSESAFKLVDISRQAGWKKSGVISSKNIVEMLSTELLATPVANNSQILVEDEYLKLLVSEANNKLSKTRDKIKKLENAL